MGRQVNYGQVKAVVYTLHVLIGLGVLLCLIGGAVLVRERWDWLGGLLAAWGCALGTVYLGLIRLALKFRRVMFNE